MARSRNASFLVAASLIALLMLAVSPLRFAGGIEERAGTIVAPLTTATRDAVRPITDVLLHAGRLSELTTENAELRRDLARAEAEAARLREERIAIEQIAALTAAVGDPGRYVSASVILRDPAPGRQVLLLDRGANDGVREGQPVVGPGSTLVGVVTQVGPERARVRLLTDRASSIAAVVQSSRTPGSLDGTGEALRLNFVAPDAHVAVGDAVLTGSLGGLLPPGLLVGKVTAIDARSQEIFPTVTVEPLASFDRLEQVLVMTDFRPDSELPLETTGR